MQVIHKISKIGLDYPVDLLWKQKNSSLIQRKKNTKSKVRSNLLINVSALNDFAREKKYTSTLCYESDFRVLVLKLEKKKEP